MLFFVLVEDVKDYLETCLSAILLRQDDPLPLCILLADGQIQGLSKVAQVLLGRTKVSSIIIIFSVFYIVLSYHTLCGRMLICLYCNVESPTDGKREMIPHNLFVHYLYLKLHCTKPNCSLDGHHDPDTKMLSVVEPVRTSYVPLKFLVAMVHKHLITSIPPTPP